MRTTGNTGAQGRMIVARIRSLVRSTRSSKSSCYATTHTGWRHFFKTVTGSSKIFNFLREEYGETRYTVYKSQKHTCEQRSLTKQRCELGNYFWEGCRFFFFPFFFFSFAPRLVGQVTLKKLHKPTGKCEMQGDKASATSSG